MIEHDLFWKAADIKFGDVFNCEGLDVEEKQFLYDAWMEEWKRIKSLDESQWSATERTHDRILRELEKISKDIASKE